MRSDRPARPERRGRGGRGSGEGAGADRAPGLPPPLPLAHGRLEARDAAEFEALKEQIRTESGLFCQGYKEKCLRRRIGVRMRARGVHTYADYAALLDRDDDEYRKLLDTVTINVSKFYRNPEVWARLSERALPELFERSEPVRIWCAGAASGEEPYTLAIVLLEYARAHGRTGELDRFTITAVDIDARALERARVGEYGALAFADADPAIRERYFQPGEPARVKDEVRALVEFRQADIIRDRLPLGLDVLTCRNVFIYFERELQEDLLWRFYEALRPGGWLVLGKVESLLGPVVGRMETVAARERLYRKT